MIRLDESNINNQQYDSNNKLQSPSSASASDFVFSDMKSRFKNGSYIIFF